ncbi:hypothetical protein GCM10020000_15290 [Streptomyces olivoverticillatus]
MVSVNLCPREEEFAGPLWRLGQRWFAPLANGLIAVVHGRGAQRLGILDPETGELVDAAGPWTEWAPHPGGDRHARHRRRGEPPARRTKWWSSTHARAGPVPSAPGTPMPWTPPTTPSRT